ncbi:hypothetical protein H7U19_06140 [Hyunsoonleella sp. SJ7]|uniref:Uncharacterized protein n=1 Tax=Hyunsoonleella aquatilis TaxID=2762758 RepID=A0A923H841_9FLAO|nr:hypothetical protein [Hyunsoonleella aquatilis]MBC3757975.1 hypothetical protein [Hyunsoonleella aquatilis]
MAPIKFEDDFKDKLDQRTIKPSEDAWEKLSAQLDEADGETQKSKGIWWFAVAASVVGLLFVAFQFFNRETEQQSPVIVDTKDSVIEPKKEQDVELVNAEKSTVAVETEVPVQKQVGSKQRIRSQSKEQLLVPKEASVQIAQEETVQKEELEKEVIPIKNAEALTFETKKVQEVADAIFNLSETDSGVTSENIDSLLKVAQREILLDRMKGENKAVVDVALLLQEVEFELDKSFRDKVFETLKKSYGSVKTAIAHRND